MAKAVINAGVCGFITEITAESEDMATATIRISSKCPAYAPLSDRDIEINAYAACFSKLGENEVFELFRPTCRHAACPVPTGALKVVEAACGLALPRDVSIVITK